jgi:drug/metabolite transporter (DMT)-like permease
MDPMAGATFAIAALPAILFMGLITTAFVLWAQTAAMGEVPSSEAGVIFATEPIFAAVWASLMLGDSLTAEEAMGGTLIIVACLATQLKLEDEGEEAAAAQSK